MKVFLDTEFNGFEGELISIALVSEGGDEFYKVVNYPLMGQQNPWVAENVIPVIGPDMEPVGGRIVYMLSDWLCGLGPDVEVIADWPGDFKHFWDSLSIGSIRYRLPEQLRTRLIRGLDYSSKIPHNALEDARAQKIAWEERFGGN